MINVNIILALAIFSITILFIMWRPFGINESIPTAIGAVFVFLFGMVSINDLYYILGVVSGAGITILSTIVMSIVLESIGFFRWAAFNLANRANGFGIMLFWNINLLCFLMTLFFNNDGSILITTPIIIQTLHLLKLKPHQKIPYLLSGALIATGSSAPIGVSNLANLIALKIVGLDLNSYAKFMFLPSMIGLLTIAFLLFFYFRNEIPKRIPILASSTIQHITSNSTKDNKPYHPLSLAPEAIPAPDWGMFRICIFIVVLIRISFFALAPLEIPTEYPAIIGALLLLAVRWFRKSVGAYDVLKKTPWHILIFAFSMYVLIYGLHNVGLTKIIVEVFGGVISSNHLNAIFVMGVLLTFMSNIFNNLPSIMIGTLSLTLMNLNLPTLQAAYLANVIGADIGALLLPMGTLASLLWMYLLRENKILFTWGQYIKITILVIPIGLIVSLLSLFVWTQLLSF